MSINSLTHLPQDFLISVCEYVVADDSYKNQLPPICKVFDKACQANSVMEQHLKRVFPHLELFPQYMGLDIPLKLQFQKLYILWKETKGKLEERRDYFQREIQRLESFSKCLAEEVAEAKELNDLAERLRDPSYGEYHKDYIDKATYHFNLQKKIAEYQGSSARVEYLYEQPMKQIPENFRLKEVEAYLPKLKSFSAFITQNYYFFFLSNFKEESSKKEPNINPDPLLLQNIERFNQ